MPGARRHRAGVQGVFSHRPPRGFEVLALTLAAPRPVQPTVLRAAVCHRPACRTHFELADGHLLLVAIGQGADEQTVFRNISTSSRFPIRLRIVDEGSLLLYRATHLQACQSVRGIATERLWWCKR